MMISLLLLFALSSGPLFTAGLDCPYTMTRSTVAHVKAYYIHEWPAGVRYVYTSTPELLQVRTHYIHAQGHPVAIEWYVEGRLVKTCGVVPSQIFPSIFANGFEGGNTDAWSSVVP